MLGNRVAGPRLCQLSSLPPQHWQIVPTFYQRVTLLAQCFPDWSQTTHRPGADTLKNSYVNNRCQLQSETGWRDGSCEQGHIHTCICVRDPICMPACLHIYWYGQSQTESDHCWSLIRPPISSLAHSGTMMGIPLCPCAPPFPNAPQPTPDLFSEDWSPSLCPVRWGSAAQTMPFPPQWTSMLFPQTFPGTGLKGTHRYGIWPI